MKTETVSTLSIRIAGHLLLWYSACIMVYCSWSYVRQLRVVNPVEKSSQQQLDVPVAPFVVQPAPTQTVTAPEPEEKDIIDPSLFGQHLDEDGMPQHVKYIKADTKKNVNLKWACDDASLQKLFNTVRKHTNDPKTQAWMAAVAYVESRGRADCIADKSSRGSYGAWQINKKYHPSEISKMGLDWKVYDTNIRSFISVINKQKAWRKGRDDFHGISSYYNAGNSWKTSGKRYADKVMSVMSTLEDDFKRVQLTSTY